MSSSFPPSLHYTFDPFQVYCYRRRAEIMQKNLKANSSTVTSLIAAEWRQLTQNEKQVYVNIANSLINNVKNQKDSPRSKAKALKSQHELKFHDTHQSNQTDPEADLYIPQLNVISRGNFGKNIEEISKKVIDDIPPE